MNSFDPPRDGSDRLAALLVGLQHRIERQELLLRVALATLLVTMDRL